MVKPLMFWVVKQRRWTKQYRGKTYSVSPKQLHVPPTKEASIQAANEWWRRKQAEIDTTPALPPDSFYQKQQRGMAKWFREHGQEDDARRMEGTSEEFEDHYHAISEVGKWVWADRLQRDKQDIPADKKLSSFVAIFLAQKLAEVGVEIVAGRYDNLQRAMKNFQSFVGEMEIGKLNGIQLAAYRDNLLGKITSKNISRDYAKGFLQTTKQFFRWLWEREYIDNLPRNLAKITITIPPKKQEMYPMDELKRLILQAKPRLKLCLLLMANCGFTQKDVSDLRKDEISQDFNYITRRHSKTAKQETAPIVRYKLWTETRQLLRAALCKDKTYALCNGNGHRLLVREMKDGKMQCSDNIACSFSCLCRRLEMKKRPLKLFRKTSATLLKNSQFGHLQSLFLGHRPRDMADRHYSGEVSLDDAIDYLGKQYGIE